MLILTSKLRKGSRKDEFRLQLKIMESKVIMVLSHLKEEQAIVSSIRKGRLSQKITQQQPNLNFLAKCWLSRRS